jgi:hypothetical protein
MARTSRSSPSSETVTVLLRAAYPTVVPATASTATTPSAIRTVLLRNSRVTVLLCPMKGTILRTSFSPVLGCRGDPARKPQAAALTWGKVALRLLSYGLSVPWRIVPDPGHLLHQSRIRGQIANPGAPPRR